MVASWKAVSYTHLDVYKRQLLVLIAIVSTLSPNFFTINNLFNILQQTSVNAIMAVGMTPVSYTHLDVYKRQELALE